MTDLVPILVLLAVIAVVVARLPKVDLGHEAAFERRRQFDLDDIGAPIGELAYAGGARTDPGQVEHGIARKRLAGGFEWHWSSSGI